MKYIKYFEQELDYNELFIDYINFGNLYKAFDLLAKYPVDLEYEDEDGWTPLRMAIYKNRTEIIEKLIELGVNIEQPDEEDLTPLMSAGQYSHRDIIIMLIEAGADWNAKDKYGWDCLDHINTDLLEEIIEDYPEKYQEYLMKKDAEKYNI